MRTKIMTRVSLFLMMLFFALRLSAVQIQTPKGFHKKVYESSFALYTSSEMAGTEDRFTCTVTAYQKVSGGYLLIGAGHCTSANVDEMPPDLIYGVAEDLGQPVHSVVLLKSVMNEPLDYAIYYFPTTKKYPVISLGSEAAERVGDKTVDVNFSLGAAKMVSTGIVSSVVITSGGIRGFYLVSQFDSHGASGSSVVSENTHKVVGLVIAGWDGETMPAIVEPITSVEKEIGDITSLLRKAQSAPVAPVHSANQKADEQSPSFFRNHDHNSRGNHDRDGRRDNHRGDGLNLDRNTHHPVDRNRDVRAHRGHRDIFFGGFWFSCGVQEWPEWIFTSDVFVEEVGPNVYVIYSYNDPAHQIQVFVEE